MPLGMGRGRFKDDREALRSYVVLADQVESIYN